jgi:hypothetical protein
MKRVVYYSLAFPPIDPDGSVRIVDNRGSEGYEIPLEALPRSVAERIVAATFSPPADLHFDATTA